MSKFLAIQGLTVRFGGLTALDAVDLVADEGEFIGVIGPNGAGKTTFFNAISGMVQPTSGALRFCGKDLTGAPPYVLAHAGMARTFQTPRVFGQLTVAENVQFALDFVGNVRRRHDSFAEAKSCGSLLERVDLGRYAHLHAGSLPPARQRQLEIAMALATHPRLLLLDEVAAGLTEAGGEGHRRAHPRTVGRARLHGDLGRACGERADAHGRPRRRAELRRENRRRQAGRRRPRPAGDRGLPRRQGNSMTANTNPPLPRPEGSTLGVLAGEGRGGWTAACPSPNPLPANGKREKNGLELEVRDLRAGYGGLPVLHGISLCAPVGRTTVLVGANGAGKTTLLKTLAGVMPPVSGSVLLDGEALAGDTPAERVRRGMALVPEGRHLFPDMSVRENLELGGYLATRSRRDAMLETVVGIFPRLGERLAQMAGTMSGGEQQMLAIGRALMSRPRLLLLDEPSLGLAPKMVDEMFAALTRINRDGTTLLLIEQNVFQALAVADYAYVLSHGEMIAAGAAWELRGNDLIRRVYLGEAIAD
ncbi:MAG: ATP-binding cassette domain-containing protein [Rhodocyclaceae bacterium]|nr:ATP-binding cassette domain-containing protein [Rhodocyclaceae bacterium]